MWGGLREIRPPETIADVGSPALKNVIRLTVSPSLRSVLGVLFLLGVCGVCGGAIIVVRTPKKKMG